MSRDPYIFIAAYLILVRKNRTLLLRRYQTGWQDGKYSLVAGHVEEGEKVREALCREAYEEAGIRLRPADLKMVNVMQRFCPEGRIYIDFFFSAERWKGEVRNKEPHKCDDLSWFPLRRIPKNTLPYVRKVLTGLMPKKRTFYEFRS
jgi:8-oxo-dGTP diphosphatase